MQISKLRLEPFQNEEIQIFIKEVENRTELPCRLFPSKYKRFDIMRQAEKCFFYCLEKINPELRIDIICKLFQYCHDLRINPDLFDIALSIPNSPESLQRRIDELYYLKETPIDELDEFQIEDIDNLDEEIKKCQNLLNIINENYNIHDVDWIFIEIAKFLKNHINTYSTEQFLWSFCIEYFEEEDLKTLSNFIKEKNGIEFNFDVEKKFNFPFKIGIPFSHEILVDVDGTKFTDCVESSILYFLYMNQPTKVNLIIEFWDSINSPFKEQIKNFFLLNGPKKSNNRSKIVRKKWAEIVSKIPGIIYNKKTDQSLESNNVEIIAAWCNYLKTIAYLKNNKKVWDQLCSVQKKITDEKEISSNMKEMMCNCFSDLAGKNLESIEWINGDCYEGIKDMEDGTLDLLGKIRCSFTDVPEKIDFVMRDGHAFIVWMND